MAEEYDGIIIGAGPNGLTVAAYLAKAGLKILLLEKRFEAGGRFGHRTGNFAGISPQHPRRIHAYGRLCSSSQGFRRIFDECPAVFRKIGSNT